MWYLIGGLAWIAAMAVIIARYNRKQRERGSERATQMAALLADLKANPKAQLNMINKPAAPSVTAAAQGASVREFSKRQRLLQQPAALLYYVFRTGLPDHEVFAGVALGDVLEVASTPGNAQREQQMRRLAQERVDLVICNKQLEIVAAVVVNGSTAGRQSDSVQFATRCLQAAGVRVVSVDPAAPPRHHQVHALIYS